MYKYIFIEYGRTHNILKCSDILNAVHQRYQESGVVNIQHSVDTQVEVIIQRSNDVLILTTESATRRSCISFTRN